MYSESAEKELEERTYLSLLYDFYGALLKENQKRMFEEHILEDYNFAEIAESEGISRQGVHDSIKRATRQLHEYEQKLGLVTRFQKQKQSVKKLQTILQKFSLPEASEEQKMVEQILTELLEE